MPITSAAIDRMVSAAIARQMPVVIRASADSHTLAGRARSVLAAHAELDVDEAIRDGRISETDRAQWLADMTEAPGVVRRLLASQAPGQYIPAADQAAEDELYAQMFPAG
jgi:hypothetical protein